MNKKILLFILAAFLMVGGVVAMSAWEAHVINVTAHIENALYADTYGIDFGTVFPQENLEKPFGIHLSDSFKDQTRLTGVDYQIVQKPKPWRDDFVDGEYPEHRSLHWVDPDGNGSYQYVYPNGGDGQLEITTGDDVEDLYGPGEPPSGTDWSAPRKVIRVGGNFTVETKVTADPGGFTHGDANYQSGGILVYGSDGNVVRLELTSWGENSNEVYMESQEEGYKVGKRYTVGAGIGDTVYLRLERDGDQFMGYYKENPGDEWSEVSDPREDRYDFTNEHVDGYPQVGLAVTDNNANEDNQPFSAKFEYIEVNGQYKNLCRFLSKMKDGEDSENDQEVLSYYVEDGNGDHCVEPDSRNEVATGHLGVNDPSDNWLVDLKVPPIAGYVGQDWPESCRQDWVVSEEADYGCDLWVEVTGVEGGQYSPGD